MPSALPTLRTPFNADLDTIRVAFRITGVLLVGAGALNLATAVTGSLRGRGGWSMLAAIGGVAVLIGGTQLLAQRYSAGPDTVRRSTGILGMAIGAGLVTHSLQDLLGGVADGTDVLGLLTMVNLVLGFSIVLLGAISLRARRYSAWYQRRWEKSELRRRERLAQRR